MNATATLSDTKTAYWNGRDLYIKDSTLPPDGGMLFNPGEQIKLVEFLESIAEKFM